MSTIVSRLLKNIWNFTDNFSRLGLSFILKEKNPMV